MEIDLRIKEILEEKNMTMYALDIMLGKRPGTTSMLLKSGNPRYKTLFKMSKVLNVEFKDLFTITDKKK